MAIALHRPHPRRSDHRRALRARAEKLMLLHVDSRCGLDGGTEIEVRGEIDLATVAMLRSAVVDAIAAGARRVLLMLDGVTYIDSAGLGTLIGAHKRLTALGGELVVRCEVERVLRLFRMTGVDQVLTIRAEHDAPRPGVAPGHSSSAVDSSPCVPGRGAHGSS